MDTYGALNWNEGSLNGDCAFMKCTPQYIDIALGVERNRNLEKQLTIISFLLFT